MQMHAEAPALNPYEMYVSSELQQYDHATAGLVGTHDLLRTRALSELRSIRLFDEDRLNAWNTYQDFTAQLPVYTNELMQAARYRIGGMMYGEDAEIWTDAHNFVLDYGYVPATIGQASSSVVTRAMQAGLDGVVFQKAYERSVSDGRPVLATGMSSYAANTLVALATDQELSDRLLYEADRLSMGNFVRRVVGSQLSERTKGVARAVVEARAAAVSAQPAPGYYAYVQGAEEQLHPYARALDVLRSVQDRLKPDLHYIFTEPLADVQQAVDLVDALRSRAWYRRESVPDGKVYQWVYTAWERAGATRLGEQLEQVCNVLYALMNGDTNGRLPF